jgi:predicted secreted protein
MADNQMQIKVNEERTIQLPSRASSGLRIVFTVSDSSVASITKKDLQRSDMDSLNIRPGDPLPAIFIIKGLKKGSTVIHFAERRPGVNDGPDISLKDFDLKVDD